MLDFPFNPNATHLFSVHDKLFAYDVHGSNFLEIDQPIWDALQLGTKAGDRQTWIQELSALYDPATVESVVTEVDALTDEGILFTSDALKGHGLSDFNGVGTLCVNVAQTCNLRCRYCFAGDGSYGKKPALMSLETAKQTVDCFIEHSGKHRNLSFCFFGGEPLLNFETMRHTVDYALERTKNTEKSFRFNVTTNGTLLSEPVRKFLDTYQFGVIVSIDGDREVQDAMRPFTNGKGSYDTIRGYLEDFQQEDQTKNRPWTLRGTFTRQNMNFADHVFHLAEMGFQDISVESCASKDLEYGFTTADLPALKAEYLDLANRYLEAYRVGQRFSFFHFQVMMNQAMQGTQRLAQCGAGRGYLGVSTEGMLYPCHRLIGMDSYQMGNIVEGVTRPEIRQLFSENHVNAKSHCQECWARYICGGGCHACAIQINGNITKPYDFECEIIKLRIELGAYIYSELSKSQQDSLNLLSKSAAANRPHLNVL